LRIGIVSDVHGNAAGLAAALDRMGSVDLLLCAGDMVEEYRFSNETVELLRNRNAICVLGNHDLGLLGRNGERARRAPHVRADLVEWLASHPLRHDLEVAGKKLLLTHASPCEPYTQYVMRQSPELKRMRDIEADYIVIGHTHAQMAEPVGRAVVINPGSVGQARDHSNGKLLSYAVLYPATGVIEFDNYDMPARAEGTAA
jgi:putative phosphoesterase